MARKKVISLAKKTNAASKYTTKELFEEINSKPELLDGYEKCLCIIASDNRVGEDIIHKFNYMVAGFKSRLELLGVIEYIKKLIIDDMTE